MILKYGVAQVVTDPATDSVYIDEETESDIQKGQNSNDTATLRAVPPPIVDSTKNRKEFAYANDPDYWKKEVEERQRSSSFFNFLRAFFASEAVRIIFYILIAAVLIYVVYRVIVDNHLFQSSGKRINRTQDQNNEELELMKQNLDKKLSEAIARGDYRMAVRFLYLQTLKNLNDHGWIRYDSNGTNHQYLSQVNSRTSSREFNYLTNAYDYVWYGEFTLTEQQFGQVHNGFKNFNRIIHS